VVDGAGADDRRRVHGHHPTTPTPPPEAGSVYPPPMPTRPAEPAVGVTQTPSPGDGRRALYRRWRAQRFAELLGQDPIVTTLRNAVAGDRIAHAYLFVGPRGTGKTSTARILAKAINCTNRGADGEPCDRCPACVSIREGRAMDVIEIDAASHGLVEDARDLVMRAFTSPAELRKRVYIIDEVHMLSTHAFNALLKLVEEPPDHVVFILATTDTHKVPPTIVSRTQRFDFRRLAPDVIAGKLARIAQAEGAAADPEALALLARLADGAMRDAESLLDQVLAYAGERLTEEAVREAVGLADEPTIAALLDALILGDAPGALGRIASLADLGRDLGQVAAQAEAEARRRLLASAADPSLARRLASVLRTLAEAAAAGAREGRARLMLELLAVDSRIEARPAMAAPQPSSAPAVEAAPRVPNVRPGRSVQSAVAAQSQAVPSQASALPVPPSRADPPAAGAPAAASVAGSSLGVIQQRWPEVIERAAPAIKPLLRECRPAAVDGVRLTLAFPEERGFMRTKVTARSAAIEGLLGEVLGGTWAIECVAGNLDLEPLTIQQAVAPDPTNPADQIMLDKVLSITGGSWTDTPEAR